MLNWFNKLFRKQPTQETEDASVPAVSDDPKPEENLKSGWIGVDLDGTLADYTVWKGLEYVGKPIPTMKQRVLNWIEMGYTIKIVTARASEIDGIPPVVRWLKDNGFPPLEVTNEKDFQMIELWDDRAIQVISNTGKPVIRPTQSAIPSAPLFEDEVEDETFERGQ